MQNTAQTFEEDPPRLSQPDETESLVLNIEGYEGPLNVLLDLAQKQKVDLMEISILALARQYLAFIETAQRLNLKLAAEYLVMAAWLAYLKSRLLLPKEKEDEEHSAEDMAEALQFQLKRLESMQKAADNIQNRPQLGHSVFARGMPEGLRTTAKTAWSVSLYDMLQAYGDIQRRSDNNTYDIKAFELMSMDEALSRLGKMLGELPRSGKQSAWATLDSFLPETVKDKLFGRSAMASTMTAALEMAKQGQLEIRQDGLFRPVYMRATY
jgi:segregation and condensation protein A